MEAPRQFLKHIREYIELIDGHQEHTPYELLRRCVYLLPSIYADAADLPNVNVERDQGHRRYEVPRQPLYDQVQSHLGIYDVYLSFFDPCRDKNFSPQSLADDLVDIYLDLKKNLLKYEDGRFGDAIWGWKFNHGMHYGQHIAWAMYAMHLQVYQHMDRDYVSEGPSALGKTWKVVVTEIGEKGIGLEIEGDRVLLSFKQFPQFRDAMIGSILHLSLSRQGILYWPDLNLEIELNKIKEAKP